MIALPRAAEAAGAEVAAGAGVVGGSAFTAGPARTAVARRVNGAKRLEIVCTTVLSSGGVEVSSAARQIVTIANHCTAKGHREVRSNLDAA